MSHPGVRPSNGCPPTRRRKVKTGCRTCKARKVKCDESRPACQTCLKTGRVCDGYGIWGGGGNRYEQRSASNAHVVPLKRSSPATKLLIERAPSQSYLKVSSAEEQFCFEFFKVHSATKLPGVFGTNFWNALVFQVCANEPAVLHAVLALSSAHRRKVYDGASRNRNWVLPDQREEFMLRHYCKAMDFLQPKFQPAIRTALVACLIFIYLEFLRGDYKRACEHLASGMRLMNELQVRTNQKKPLPHLFEALSLVSSKDCLDLCLADAYAKLQIQVNFSNQRLGLESPPPRRLLSDLPTFKFWSHQEARYYLDRIFEGVSTLMQGYHCGEAEKWPVGYRGMLDMDLRLTQGSLDAWLHTYEATIGDLVGNKNSYELFCYNMLHLYHTMADIMAATCMSLDDQTVYDKHLPSFLSIIVQSNNVALNKIPFSEYHSPFDTEGGFKLHTCRPWSDMGWIPPLYYTALKCRNHRIRTQAIKLMSYPWHKEGVWDLTTALVVSREVVRMEEGDFFENLDNEFDASCTPSNRELFEEKTLPENRRFHKVDMVIENAPKGLELICKKKVRGRWIVIHKVYNEKESSWTEVQRDGDR